MSLSARRRRSLLVAAIVASLLTAFYAVPGRDGVKPRPGAGERPAVMAAAAAPNPNPNPNPNPAAGTGVAAAATGADRDIEQAQRRLQPPERSGDIEDAFAARSWAPPPPPEAARAQAPVPVANAAPVPPPLPYQYMGQLTEQGETLVFLMRGEVPVIGRVGQTVDDSYRIERVADNAVEFTYLPLKARQALPTGGPQ